MPGVRQGTLKELPLSTQAYTNVVTTRQRRGPSGNVGALRLEIQYSGRHAFQKAVTIAHISKCHRIDPTPASGWHVRRVL
jgi:hypothetical protein